jgi:YfiH family protein
MGRAAIYLDGGAEANRGRPVFVSLCLRSSLLDGHGFVHGFSLRTGGVSLPPFDTLNLAWTVGDDAASVEKNRSLLASAIGYAPEALYEVSQVHGASVRVVAAGDTVTDVRRTEADALVAQPKRGALGVRVADCVPLLLADVESRAVAAVHAGWRGAVRGVVAATVDALGREAGTRPSALVAAIGPHIRVDAFEVGDDVATEISAAAQGRRVVRGNGPRPFVDLSLVVRAQLEALGVPADAIDDIGGCTHGEPARFFSFRRDGARSGRHLAVIVS